MNSRLYPMAAGNFAIGTGMFVTAGLLPPISADLGVSRPAAGQLMTVFALAYAVLSPLLAALTARMSRRTLLLLALSVFVAGSVLTAVAPTYELVMLTRVVAAAGAAMFTPTSSAVANALTAPERRGRALALVMGGLSVSSAIGVPLGTWLGGTAGWRATLWMVVGLGLVGLVGVAALVPEVRIPVSGRLRDRFEPLRDRGVLAVMVTQLLVFSAGFSAYTYIGSLFDLPLPALLWAWGLGGVVGNLLGGRLTDAYGPRRMILVGLGSSVAFLALIPVANLAMPVALAWGFLWGATGWLIAPAQQFRTVTAVPGNVPIGLGLLSSAQYFGLFVAGLAGGAALEAYGRTGVVVVSVALGVLALAFTLLTYRAPAKVGVPAG
ncbi:MFS transporter [Nonomuraea sp. MG754425]|uniref:MFS transporter n=1 Tax=Nonomuraea sp. MG754425 TaxID=2570319 RepID=UPI001F39322E|nr:MFS transporter [Nonomuraea sp. MG754425]MCF6473721.1 MFS transporter [Nonomuraea sp. MG754425]